jgi:hypothetical protein
MPFLEGVTVAARRVIYGLSLAFIEGYETSEDSIERGWIKAAG